jgi:Ca2+-binding EF-hand superfamily protein
MKAFEEADHDKDGWLAKDELKVWMEKMAEGCDQKCTKTVDELFAEIDTDKNGKITLMEIMKFMKK